MDGHFAEEAVALESLLRLLLLAPAITFESFLQLIELAAAIAFAFAVFAVASARMSEGWRGCPKGGGVTCFLSGFPCADINVFDFCALQVSCFDSLVS